MLPGVWSINCGRREPTAAAVLGPAHMVSLDETRDNARSLASTVFHLTPPVCLDLYLEPAFKGPLKKRKNLLSCVND